MLEFILKLPIVEKIQNIFKIPELKNRILYTLALLAVFRLGSFVILPGVDSDVLLAMFERSQGEGILGLLNNFVGGAFARGAIFALGIMPYISASIIIQILGAAVPLIQKKQQEGESGQKWINNVTRILTVVITLFQSAGYVVNLQSMYGDAVPGGNSFFWLSSIFILTAGTMFLVWLGERITDNGIGNGVSLIIMIGIISSLPFSLQNEYLQNPPIYFFVEIIALGVVTMAVVALTQATRKIPVNYARRIMGNRMTGGMTNNQRQYIPLKVNSAGVMPIIFAQAIMFLPSQIAQMMPDSDFWVGAGGIFSDPNSFGYSLVFFLMIIVFTYFYTAIIINPKDMATRLKQQGGFIPGIQPGKKTTEFIDNVLTRITLPGSVFLGLVAIFPAVAFYFGISQGFSQFFGGTSLLIMIGVALDTLQQIESYLLMRHYDGLMKTGRIKRSAGAPGVSV